MANVLNDDTETLGFDGAYDEDLTSDPGIDFPHLSEYTFTLRHIENIDCDGEDSSIRLACRASNGSKVRININGLSIGMILDAVLKAGK